MKIPKQLRETYGLYPNTDVVLDAADNGIIIRPARDFEKRLKIRLQQAAGCATMPISADDILAQISAVSAHERELQTQSSATV